MINTDTNTSLTMNNIKTNLLNSGLISDDEYETVVVTSDYFDNTDSAGYYVVMVKHNDGRLDSFIINVKESSNNTETKAEQPNNNIIIYIIIGGLVLSVVIVLIIFIVIKRGRKHEENN